MRTDNSTHTAASTTQARQRLLVLVGGPSPGDERASARRILAADRGAEVQGVEVDDPALARDRQLGRDEEQLPRAARIDLGGTAKGLAVDLAADHATYAVDAGGDIRIGGTDPAPRAVRVAHPLEDEIAHNLHDQQRRARDQWAAHACLAQRRGVRPPPHRPRARHPAWTGVIQATALAPTALEAETLAKTALLSGPQTGRRLLERHGGALILDGGALILDGGELIHAGDLDPAPVHTPAPVAA